MTCKKHVIKQNEKWFSYKT